MVVEEGEERVDCIANALDFVALKKQLGDEPARVVGIAEGLGQKHGVLDGGVLREAEVGKGVVESVFQVCN